MKNEKLDNILHIAKSTVDIAKERGLNVDEKTLETVLKNQIQYMKEHPTKKEIVKKKKISAAIKVAIALTLAVGGTLLVKQLFKNSGFNDGELFI